MSNEAITAYIARVRELQGKATQGEWKSELAASCQKILVDDASVPLGYRVIASEEESGHCLKLLPDGAMLPVDFDYIADVCSPSDGHLTRLLKALERATETIDFLIGDDDMPAPKWYRAESGIGEQALKDIAGILEEK